MKESRILFIALIFSWGMILVGASKSTSYFEWRYPKLTDLVVTEHYPIDLGFLTQGAHRAAANLAYIHLLQYYGTPVAELQEREHKGHDHEGHDAHQCRFGHGKEDEGNYPRHYELSHRMMFLDPFFNSAILEAAGSLAFNMKRKDEGLSILRQAILLDPSFYRYHLYVSAILFREKGRDDKLMEILLEAISYPDCPTLLENILANLLKKYGNLKESAKVYVHTIKTAAREADRITAQRGLMQVLEENRDLVPFVEALLQDPSNLIY